MNETRKQCTRREFMTASAGSGAALVLGPATSRGAKTTQIEPEGFFTVDQRGDRWWLLTPDGHLFFSLALNHIDGTPLRYPDSIHIWREKYGNSQRRWLQEAVAPDLKAWGFNSVGWVQEVVTRGDTNHRHSPNFSFEEYQWLGMPYCHMLPFADFHQWENETRFPDLFSKDFEDWCEYVARCERTRFANDPKLVGYFYLDCPTWAHDRKSNRWRGPLFDPAKLDSRAGRDELFTLASRYYQVTHDAIRRHDRHHLILGDRYEAKELLPEPVVRAAKPYVDVLAFQHFDTAAKVKANLDHWNHVTGMPTLFADGCGDWREGDAYADMVKTLRETPSCIGLHLCGAYLKNNTRKRGLREEGERIHASVARLAEVNREMARWVQRQETGS